MEAKNHTGDEPAYNTVGIEGVVPFVVKADEFYEEIVSAKGES